MKNHSHLPHGTVKSNDPDPEDVRYYFATIVLRSKSPHLFHSLLGEFSAKRRVAIVPHLQGSDSEGIMCKKQCRQSRLSRACRLSF